MIYAGLVLLFVLLGLLSRRVPLVPLWVGDSLWAMMIYAGVRFLALSRSKRFSLWVTLVICYGIECSHLIQVPWLIALRQTTLGHLILGQGFLWSDLVAYSLGLVTIWIWDTYGHTVTERRKDD